MQPPSERSEVRLRRFQRSLRQLHGEIRSNFREECFFMPKYAHALNSHTERVATSSSAGGMLLTKRAGTRLIVA